MNATAQVCICDMEEENSFCSKRRHFILYRVCDTDAMHAFMLEFTHTHTHTQTHTHTHTHTRTYLCVNTCTRGVHAYDLKVIDSVTDSVGSVGIVGASRPCNAGRPYTYALYVCLICMPYPRSENLLSNRIWGIAGNSAEFCGILRNQVSFPYFRKKECHMGCGMLHPSGTTCSIAPPLTYGLLWTYKDRYGHILLLTAYYGHIRTDMDI